MFSVAVTSIVKLSLKVADIKPIYSTDEALEPAASASLIFQASQLQGTRVGHATPPPPPGFFRLLTSHPDGLCSRKPRKVGKSKPAMPGSSEPTRFSDSHPLGRALWKHHLNCQDSKWSAEGKGIFSQTSRTEGLLRHFCSRIRADFSASRHKQKTP